MHSINQYLSILKEENVKQNQDKSKLEECKERLIKYCAIWRTLNLGTTFKFLDEILTFSSTVNISVNIRNWKILKKYQTVYINFFYLFTKNLYLQRSISFSS